MDFHFIFTSKHVIVTNIVAFATSFDYINIIVVYVTIIVAYMAIHIYD